MDKLVWDQIGEKLYETGAKNGVLYIPNKQGEYVNGYAWNGLTGVDENPSGAEATDIYADDNKYVTLMSAEKYACTIKAYTYPEQFEQCDGSAQLTEGVTIGQQERKSFGFSYRTAIGNDVDGNDHGYKLHLVYGCLASPSSKSYNTINDSPEAIEFSWEVNTTPVNVANHKPTATLEINSKIGEEKMAAIEAILYGVNAEAFSTEETYKVGECVTYMSKTYICVEEVSIPGEWNEDNWSEIKNPGPRLPLPDEVLEILG